MDPIAEELVAARAAEEAAQSAYAAALKQARTQLIELKRELGES